MSGRRSAGAYSATSGRPNRRLFLVIAVLVVIAAVAVVIITLI
jgi:hypothetical protein